MARIIVVLLFIAAVVFFWFKIKPAYFPTSTIFEYSEGTCVNPNDCTWAGDSCGGGHGVCTNQPVKYAGMASTCDVNSNFPANKGYSCSCVQSQGKCGWVK